MQQLTSKKELKAQTIHSLQCNYVSRALASLSPLLLCGLLNCGPKFTSHDYFQSAGDSGSGEAGEAGSADNTATAGASGAPQTAATAGAGGLDQNSSMGGSYGGAGESSGGTSSGGSSPTASAGEAGSMVQSRECLSNYDKRECGNACTGSAYPACRLVLNCLIEKNVKPPQGSLDPCYPEEYIPLKIAISVYDACCQQ
jgi:hypothetical protein